jgi:hypothetical protein
MWALSVTQVCSSVLTVSRSPIRNDQHIAKRVIGLPRDIVRTRSDCDTRLVEVPAGHYWVEGDAGPEMSMDSNYFGPVPRELIVSTLDFTCFPVKHFGPFQWQVDLSHRLATNQNDIEWYRGIQSNGLTFDPKYEVQQLLKDATRYRVEELEREMRPRVTRLLMTIDKRCPYPLYELPWSTQEASFQSLFDQWKETGCRMTAVEGGPAEIFLSGPAGQVQRQAIKRYMEEDLVRSGKARYRIQFVHEH